MTTLARVVLDTNVVLSALVFGAGSAGRLRLAWEQRAFLPLASTSTARELVRVLAYPKFRLTAQEQEELLADYLPYSEVVPIPSPAPRVPHCRDPLDAPFMQLALVGKAKMLVSGDRDLLALAAEFEQVSGCRIVSLDTFLHR